MASRESIWFSILFGDYQLPRHVRWRQDSVSDLRRTSSFEPYGRRLGAAPGNVHAFSNGWHGQSRDESNCYRGIFTGIKWQCVEFARRWLLMRHGLVFPEVGGAVDLWTAVEYYSPVGGGEPVPVLSYLNGSPEPPEVGDLLVYSKILFGTGHVAVVTGIDRLRGVVQLGEQNYRNARWSSDHARHVPLMSVHGRHWLLDAHLLGWKRMAAGRGRSGAP